MTYLNIQLLGGFSVSRNDEPLHGFRSTKSRGLLAWIACQPDIAHQRTTLATLFWRDYPESSARTNLRIELSALKKKLNAHPALEITRNTVRFHRQFASVDLLEFWDAEDDPMTLVARYSGEFLAGLQVDDAPDFEDWKLLMQERIHRQMMRALDQLRESCATLEQWEALIDAATRQLGLVAWHEGAHRSIIEALAAQGDVAGARAQYERCRAVLDAELGVAPAVETQAIFRALGGATHRQTLPLPRTSFFGRKSEQSQLLTLLDNPDYPLITLLGTGGIGKTHLALSIGQVAHSRFIDGVLFVALEQTEPDNDAIALAILDALGSKATANSKLLDQVVTQLHGKQLLLILDNFEHLVEHALFIDKLLQRLPTLHILVTSRVRLELRAEYVFRLEGLELPVDDDVKGIQAESVRLFLDRCERHGVEARLSAENIAAITQICRAVDGMPLAIELATATARYYPLTQIAQEIDSNIAVLSTHLRDVPLRQRSLIATCAYAWELLTPEQQQLLMGAAYFAGGFSQRAGITILETTPHELMQLVDRSLLRLTADRYTLHPHIMQFSAEKGIPPSTPLAHANYYALRLGELFNSFLAQRTTETYTPALDELPNILKSWRTLIHIGAVEALLPFAKALFALFAVHGRLHAGLAAFQPAQQQLAGVALQSAEHQLLAANVAARTGYFLLFLARHAEAKALLEPALTILHTLGDKGGIEFALTALSDIVKLEGDFEQGLRLAQMAFDLVESAEPTERRARGLGNLGIALNIIGRYQEAHDNHQAALAINRELASDTIIAISLNNLGSVLISMGRLDEAELVLAEGLALRRRAGNQHRIAASLRELGSLALARCQPTQALTYYAESFALFANEGVIGGQLVGLLGQAKAHLQLQSVDAAYTVILQAIPLAIQLGETPRALRLVSVIGEWLIRIGQQARGRELLRWVAGSRSAAWETRQHCMTILGEEVTVEQTLHDHDWQTYFASLEAKLKSIVAIC